MDVSESESAEYAEFKSRVLQRTGIDLNQYKHQQMHRRLLGMVERSQASGFMDYFGLLERDSAALATFLDRLTINVSELFRNPEKWQDLRHRVLPPLLATKKQLRIWSAGCSYGAEAYSLAILLAQIDPRVAHSLQGTDIDQAVLTRARQGRFMAQDVRHLDAECIASFFRYTPPVSVGEDDMPSANATPYTVDPEIRSRVRFFRHNLLAEPFGGDYDVICCRNVVIYFTEAAKNRLFEQFYRALAPGGILFVGATERIFHYREIGYESVLPFFYRRPCLRQKIT